MITLWRLFIYSWKNLFRNAWIGLATIFVFMMALLSINVLLGVNVLLTRVITVLENKVDVTVTFKKDAPEPVINGARFYLTSLSQVASVQTISQEQALTVFKQRHADNPKVLAALELLKGQGNPLGAQLILKAKNPDDYPFLLQAVQNPQYATFIEKSSYDDHRLAIDRVREMGREGRIIGAILVAIFVFFGALIAFNAIRVAVYTQREEIAIMRLVGAPSFFIRGPFILEGIWLALVAIILSLGVIFGVLHSIEPMLRPFFDGGESGLVSFFTQSWPQIFLIEVIGMAGIVSLVSWAAVGKYIKR